MAEAKLFDTRGHNPSREAVDSPDRSDQGPTMKTMQPASARALTLAAALVLLAGFLVPSPSGTFIAFCLAALMAAVPVVFSQGRHRLTAVVLLLCMLALSADKYPEFRREQERFSHPTPTTGSTQLPATSG